jgi:UDP-glucose 4-epimerase
VYNIGSGINISIKEVADLLSNDQVFIDLREGEMHTTLANIEKVNQAFGWRPEIDVNEWIRGVE